MTDRDSVGDSTGPTGKAKRKIPAVTEVVEAITRRRPVLASERPGLFQAAQHVCTEEIRLVRTGFAPSTVETLADRTEKMIQRRESGRLSIDRWNENEPFGDLTIGAGAPRRRPDLAEELWPAKVEPARPIDLPQIVPEPEQAPPRKKATPPAPAAIERPIVSGPARHASRLPLFLLTFLVMGAAAGYFLWKGRGFRLAPAGGRASVAIAPSRAAVSAPASTPAPAPPAAVAPTPAKKPSPAPAPARPSPPTSGETIAANQSKAGTMRSPDWIGAPAFVLHCSSYKRRENAERDAARLSRLYGHPAHVLGVDLGSEGSWYRVVLGDFANASDAFAFRQKLLDEKAPEVGLIYQVLPAAAP